MTNTMETLINLTIKQGEKISDLVDMVIDLRIRIDSLEKLRDQEYKRFEVIINGKKQEGYVSRLQLEKMRQASIRPYI